MSTTAAPTDAVREEPWRTSAAGHSVGAQLAKLRAALASFPMRRRIYLLAIGVVVVVTANTVSQWALNRWQRTFYDAIEQKDVPEFMWQLVVFASIVIGLLVLVVAQTWLQELLKVRLREWVTLDLLGLWLRPRRAYLLGLAGEIGTNPDQRLQDDARRFTELSAELGVGLFQSTLLLISFVGVLWVLSAEVLLPTGGGATMQVPGYLVWCALGYAIAGSWLTWRVGRPLIRLNAERYEREAEFRFALVRVSESADSISLHGGEVDEQRHVTVTLDRVVALMIRLADGLARLTWVTSSYGWIAIVFPLVVAAPGYFLGSLSFGGLMMVSGAFFQVQSALRWFVDSFPRIADWRAALLRVMALRDTLNGLDHIGGDGERIAFVGDGEDRIVLRNLEVALTDGRARLDVDELEVRRGERVRICGGPGTGKTTMFRAVAGLWPWGRGTIHVPPPERLVFLSEKPYLPLGTLRASVSYPAGPQAFDDAAVRRALDRVGLGHLGESLDEEKRWDRDLHLDEQQRLLFARLLLHDPAFLVMDNAMSALDEHQREQIATLFDAELAGTAVLAFARVCSPNTFFGRDVQIVRHDAAPQPTRASPVQLVASAERGT